MKPRNALFSLIGASLLAALPALASAEAFPEELVQQGRYLATASDCVACHTAHHGKPMAGGLVIASPVGDIVSSNITPSREFGIGDYSEQQFADALRKGIRGDGAHLYPAMPYTAYSQLTDADIHALYAYFMQGVEAVEQPTEPTRLPFPMNIRLSMAGWNLLFLNQQPFEADPARSAQWNRGRYLAEGPAHCGTCHTPRGLLMQEQGDHAMAGAQVGPWYAPNITPDRQSGIGSWTRQELATYLKTGRVAGKSQAGGSMAEAVSHSFQHLTEADLSAVAEYILSLPPQPSGKEGSRFGQGQPHNELASFRGQTQVPADAQGAKLYSANCASCHGYNAQGTRDGYYPSLFHNSVTAEGNPSNLIAAILYGIDRKTADGHVFMPPFGNQTNAFNNLSDDEIASLANYLRASYGNLDSPVSAADVAVIRQGGPASKLVLMARIGIAAGVLVVVLLGLWLLRRKRRQ